MARLALASDYFENFSIKGILVILLSACALAGPTSYRNTATCATYCKAIETKKFNYETGITYVYDYSTDIKTLTLAESSQESRLSLTSKVEIEAVSSCDFKFKLTGVQISEAEDENENLIQKIQDVDYFIQELEKFSTNFAFQEGKIEHLCSNPNEPIWITNIKRGILSMLQNTMEDITVASLNVQEVDVNGKCLVRYQPSSEVSWGGATIVTKVKNFANCNNRQNYITTIQSNPFNHGSNDMGFLSGGVECSQVIRNNKFEAVQCQEEQIFKPFEQRHSGAKNFISQSLKYSNEYSTPASRKESSEMIKKSLIFEIDGLIDETRNDISASINLLEKLEKATTPIVRAEAPALFIEFVESIRQLSEEGVRSLITRTTEITAKKLVLDAIPLANSAASIAVMRDFFLQGDLNNDKLNAWLSSVAFIKSPTLPMISALLPLLEKKPATSQILLSISSVINSYCREVSDCTKYEEIQQAITKITEPLGDKCEVFDEIQQTRRAILALKSIGNTGIYPSVGRTSDIPLLQKCLMQKSNPLEVRLAAIDAHRRISCSSFSNEPLLAIYAAADENIEVRIKAYLIAMNCMDRGTVETVKTVLNTEAVNQVGSFVWTHLTNLQETNRPEKQMIRSLVLNEHLKNKFKTDARKFSRNYESSVFWDELNAGAGIDANIIFTEESFLPKSGMMNLTVQMFGESVNLLEFGGRFHATERLLEPIFGPNGYFPDESMTEFLKSTRKKRDVGENDIDRLSSVYEQASTRLEKTPGGSFYTRVFGHEVVYKDFEVNTDSSIPNVVDENGKNWFNIKSILDNLSTGKKTEFTKSTILMDVSYSVPTSAGIPLTLGFKTAATVGLSAEGKFNVGKFLEKKELEIQGFLKPNTVLDVDASLSIRLGARNRFVRSGLSVRNILRSATAVETHLVIDGYKVIKAAVNLPQDRQDIIEVSSKVLLLRASGDVTSLESPYPLPKYEKKMCVSESYADLFGLKLCGEMAIPDEFTLTPSFPAFAVVYLEKTDDFKGYSVDFKFDNNPAATKMSIVFDTPGSTINRRTAIKFNKETSIGRFHTSVETPSKAMKAVGTYSQFQKSFDLVVIDDGEKLIQLNSSMHHVGTKIEPTFTLHFFKKPIAELKGFIEIPNSSTDQKKAVVDLVLKHLTQNPIRIHGNFIANGDTHEATLGVESYFLTGNIRSHIRSRHMHLSTKSILEYSWKHGAIRTVDISAKLQKSTKGALSKFNAAAGFTMSNFPDHSVELAWETLTSIGFCENTAKFSMGKSVWEGHTLFSRQNSRDHSELRVQMSLANLRNDIDYLLEFSHKMMEESINTRLIGRTSTANEIKANFDYISDSRPFLKKNITAEIAWPGSEYSFRTALHEKQKGDFEGELLINLNKYKEMKATLSYINNSSNLRLDHTLDFRARGFSSVPISGTIAFTATDKQSHAGCQIQFEGKKPYSSRISTSIDYSHTRSTHKIEAKVTFNEKKYNGEITFGNIKSGTRHLTIDLYLENHIFIDAKITGAFPEAVLATFSLIPDKDNSPQDRLELKGSLDSGSVGLNVNYFGEKMSFAGEYGNGALKAEANWSPEQRILIHVIVPIMTNSKSSLSFFVITPLNGFRNVSASWEHMLESGKLESRLEGNLEEKSVLINLNATRSLSETSFNAMADITGYPRLESSAVLVREESKSIAKLHAKKGSTEGLILAEYVTLPDATVLKVNFKGCEFLPEVLLEWNHQILDRQITTLQLAWAFPSSFRRVIHLELEKRFNPMLYKFSIASPWSTWKTMVGTLTLDKLSSTYKIDIINTGDSNVIPSKLGVGIQGNLLAFDHYATVVWRNKEMEITLLGGLTSVTNADIEAILKFNQHNYRIKVLSKQQDNVHRAEVKVDLDDSTSKLGLEWSLGENPGKRELSVWGNLPSESEKKAIVTYDIANGVIKLSFDVIDKNQKLLSFYGVLNWLGYTVWTSHATLKSFVQSIPSFTLESTHNMLDINNIENENNLRITPLEGSYLDSADILPARNFSLKLNIKNLENIIGSVMWDDKDIHIEGDIQRQPNGNDLHLQLTSSQFKGIEMDAGYTLSEEEVRLTGLLKYDNSKMFEGDVGGVKSGETYTGTLFILSPYLPTLDGQVSIDMERRMADGFLKKDQDLIFHISTKAQANLGEGKVKITAKSSTFVAIENVLIEANYIINGNGINANVKYESTDSRYHFSADGAFSDEEKRLELTSSGEFVGSFEIKLKNLNELHSVLTHNGRNLGELQAYYSTLDTEFAWGMHTINILYKNSEKTPSNILVIFGADPKQFIFELTTPFVRWTEVKMYGHLDVQSSTSKSIKFGLQREKDKLDSAFEMKAFKRNATTSLSTEVSVVGFSELRKLIVDTVNLTNIPEGFSSGKLETFSARLRYSPSNIDLKIVTPMNRWKNVELQGNWELNRSQKLIHLKSSIDDQQYELRTSTNFKIGSKKAVAQLIFKSLQTYQADLRFDFSKQYEGELNLVGPNLKWKLGGTVEVTGKSIKVEAKTPFRGYEDIKVMGTHEQLAEKHYVSSLQWTLKSGTKEIYIETIRNDLEWTLKLRTPVEPWNNVLLTFAYDSPLTNIQLKGERGDGKIIAISMNKNTVGNITDFGSPASTNIDFKIETPFEGLEMCTISVNYDRMNSEHKATLTFGRNQNEMNGQLNLLFRSKEPLTININSRISFDSDQTESKANATLLVDPKKTSSFKAFVETDKVKYEANASVDISENTKTLRFHTSLPFLKKVYLSIDQTDTTSLRAIWKGKDMQTEVQSSWKFKGMTGGKMNFTMTSPIVGLQNIFIDCNFDITPERMSSDITFQNEDSRWLAKVDGDYEQYNGEWLAQINTPITEYQEITIGMKHTWNEHIKEIICSLGQNSAKVIELEASLKDAGLQTSLQSSIFQYPVNIHSSIHWAMEQRNFQLTLGAGDAEYKTNFEVSVKGFESGMVHIRTALLPEINSRLAWKAEGNLREGNAWASVTNSVIGTKSLRTLWKAESWKLVKAEAWMRSDEETEEKGGTFQYSLNLDRDGRRKFNAQFNFELERGTSTASANIMVKESDTKYEADLKIETPFQSLRNLNASGELSIGSESGMKFTANHNNEHLITFDGSLKISSLKSNLKFNLNAPVICKPFQTLASYDFMTDKRTLELSFKQADYIVDLKSEIHVPTETEQAELNISLYSNVPIARMAINGNVKGSYQVHSDGISEVFIVMESSQVGNWKILGALRPTSDFYLKLKFDSGAPTTIPSAELQAIWRGSIRQGISSSMSFTLSDDEYKSTLSASRDSFQLSLVTPLEGFEESVVEGRWVLDSEDKRAEINAKIGRNNYVITGNSNFTPGKQFGIGRVEVTNMNENKQMGSIQLELTEQGNLELKGSWLRHEILLRVNAAPQENNVWFRSGTTELTIVIDGSEQMALQEAHQFLNNDYYLNVSAGPSKVLKVHLSKGLKSMITAILQFNDDGRVKFQAELNPDKFDVFVSSPWTEDLAVQGFLKSSSVQTIAEGHLIFGSTKSTIRVKTSNDNDGSNYEVSLDMPVLHQKFDTTISVQATNAYRSGGKIDLVMNGRHISLAGQLSSKLLGHQTTGKQKESKLSISLTLPSQEIPEISTQITLRRPVNHFGSMKISGRWSIRDKISDIFFGYDLPLFGNTMFGLSAFLKTSGVKKYEIAMNSDRFDIRSFNGKIVYNLNELAANWDLALPEVNAAFRLITSRSGYDTNEYALNTHGYFDTTKLLNISLNAICKDKTLDFNSIIKREDQKISSEISITSPYLLGVPHNYNLELLKQDDGKYILELSGIQGRDFADLITDFHIKDSVVNASGKITGSFGSHHAKLDYNNKDNAHEAILTLESTSLLIGKKASIKGTLSKLNDGFEARIICQTRKSTHKASFVSLIKSDQGTITFKTESPLLEPISFHTEWKKDGVRYTGSVRAVYFDVINEMDGFLDLKNLEGKVTINSPLIPSSYFNVHLKSIVTVERIDILGDVQIRDLHWRLEGVLQYENLRKMTTKLEILTPYQTFDQLTLALKSSSDEIYTEIYTPITMIPNAMLRVTGVSSIQQGNWHDMHPSITVKLPFGKYSSFVVFNLPNVTNPGLGHIFLEISESNQTFDLRSEISPLGHFSLNMENIGMARVRVITPILAVRHFEAGIEGKINGKNLVQIKADGKLNEDELAFIFDYKNEDGNPKVRSELQTPFKNFEQFAFSMSVGTFHEIGTGKSFHMEFDRSDWNEEIKLDADYRYQFNGLLDMEGEVNAVLVALMDTLPLHASMKTGARDSKLSGILSGNLGSQQVSLLVETEMSEDELLASLDGKAGSEDPYHLIATIHLQRKGNEFSFRKEVLFQDENIVFIRAIVSPLAQASSGEIKISTPWGPLEATITLIPVSPFLGESDFSVNELLSNTNTTFELMFDKWRIFGFQLVSKDGHALLEVYNPIRPVSLMLNFENLAGNRLKVTSEFCWNLEEPLGKTVGIDFVSRNSFTGRYLALEVHAERAGFIEMVFSNSLTSSELNQSILFKWNSPLFDTEGTTGYHIILKKLMSPQYQNYDFSLQVDVPWRSVLVETRSNKTSKDFLRSFLLKWDAKKNQQKLISMKLHKEVKSAWKISESSHFFELIHPLSEQPLMISLDQISKDNKFQHIELDIKASEDPQSNFVFLISRNNTDWKNFRALIRHVPTNLSTELTVQSTEQKAAVDLSYMDINGITRNLKADLNFIPEGYSLGLFTVHADQQMDILKFQKVNQLDRIMINLQIISMEVDAIVHKSLPYLEAFIKHEGENRLQISGGFYHKKEIGLKVARSDFGKALNYILTTFKLNGSNVISSRISWLPDVFSNLQELDISRVLCETISPDINLENALKTIRGELEGRWNSVSPHLTTAAEDAYQLIVTESKVVYQEWKKVADYFVSLYEKNSFYLRDIYDTFSFIFDVVETLTDTVVQGFVDIGKRLSQVTTEGIIKTKEMYQKYEGKIEKAIMDWWDQVEAFVNTMWRSNLSFISSAVDNLEKLVETSLYALEGKIDEIERKLMAVGLIRKVLQIYKEYSTWIEEIPIQEYVQNVEKMLAVRIWDRLSEYLGPLIDAIKSGVEDQYFRDLLETPPLPYIRYALKNANAAFGKFWEVLEVEQKIKNLVRFSLKNVDGLVHRYLPTGSLVYDLEKGLFEYDQSLSGLQWEDFTQLPRWKTTDEDVKDVNQLTNFYYQVMDKIESLKPLLDMNIRSILPPFGSYALMAGDYHYFTFDKKYFRFAGECSYLLVADLSHTEDAFSLIVNYENRDGNTKKKSYTIISDGKVLDVDINSFKVTVNGKKVELPLIIGSTYFRRHQTGLEIFDKRGFKMSCSLNPSVCTVWVSGWHFGKIAGLLGTYDYEQINDLQNPEGLIIPDVSTFAYSWRVGKNSGLCRMKNFARDEIVPMDIDNICHDLLSNRSSPLRPCFNTVDTEVFMDMCMYDVSRNINSANRAEAACSAMSAYVAECQKNSVDIWMPPTCVRCRLEDGTALTTGENATLEVHGERPPRQSSDNIILLEESSCVSSAVIAEAVRRLDIALTSQDIWDNRYSIVGFGGNGLHEKPHIKTSSSRVWAHNTLFKVPNDTDASETSQGDLYEAIQYAATMGFRAGVSKNIIAFTCGNEQCGDPSRYADILTLLVENDIKLHILAPKQFTLKGNRKQDEMDLVFGIDMNGVYTAKHAKMDSIEPDKALRRQINIPKDLCTPLAMESNGTRFNIERPTKKVLDVWSRRVAQTSFPSECQRCECVPDRYGSASLMCHQCVSPSLWQFMEEWRSYQIQEGDDMSPIDIPFENDDFIMTMT